MKSEEEEDEEENSYVPTLALINPAFSSHGAYKFVL
jgi:hypothetical protein